MSGICGLIEGQATSEDVTRDLIKILVGGTDKEDASIRQVLRKSHAIAIQSGVTPVSLNESATLIVAIEGRPSWTSGDVRSLARERGSAAALAELYNRHGSDCLQQIHGPFAIAIVDTASASGLLAVDRMGICTMCYANPPASLVFGSTANRVSNHPDVGRRLSQQSIFDYLYCHVVPSPGTIYHAVRKLRPGECLTFRNGVAESRFYWTLDYIDDSAPLRERSANFNSLLRDAVQRAIDGDADVGAFLSGGTDSSTVTGVLTELRGKPAKTFSIGFAAQGFDEMEYARITARHFATEPHEYYVSPQDLVDAIPIIVDAYDEPFGNDSAVPTYFCARMAKESGVRVLLAGDGGDELFGGNVRYAKQKVFEAYGFIPPILRRALIESLAGIPGGGRMPPVRKLRSYIRQATVPLPDRLESYNFLSRSPLDEIFEPTFLCMIDPMHPVALMREVYERTSSASSIKRMMHLDLKFTLADNDLRKVSRMCEAAGIDVRYPLIDDAIVEFSGRIPASLNLRGLKLRYFFKQALTDLLPAETLAKSKHGFGVPFGVWLREYKPLTQLVQESLDAFCRRGIMKPSYVSNLLSLHQSSHATYFGKMIWVIMILERWLAARGT